MQDVSAQLEQITLRLSTLSHQVQILADRQRERDELLDELKPILKEMMKCFSFNERISFPKSRK